MRRAAVLAAAVVAGVAAQCRKSTDKDIAGAPYALTGNDCPAHDPAIAQDANGQYYLFATDAGNQPPFLRQWCSKDGTAWEVCAHMLPNGLPQWAQGTWRGSNCWAPDVSYFQERKLWHAYYAISLFGKTISALGLLSTPTLDPTDPAFGWKDEGMVLTTNATSDYNAIDANVVFDASGAPYMLFGSFWTGIQVVQLDATTGKPAKGAPIVNIASRDDPGDNKAIEGSFMVRNGTDYWLFVSWNTCCRGAASNYEVRVGKGPSVTGPFVDQDGKPMLQGGGTHVVGYPAANGWAAGGGQSLLRPSPGMPLPGGAGATFPRQTMVLHAYDAQSGDPWLQVIEIDWTGAWPAVVTA